MNDRNRRVVACLASYPGRIKESEVAINSLINQVDHIYIYLNLYDEIPNFLNKPNITCKLGQFAPEGDLRDLGKFHFLDIFESEIVLLVDDDIQYPTNYASTMVDRLDKYDGQVVMGVHGRTLKPNFKNYFIDSHVFHFRRSLKSDLIVDVLGTGTVAFDAEKIKFQSDSFTRSGKADIDFAIAARNGNHPLIAVSRNKSWLTDATSLEGQGHNLYLEFKNEGVQHAEILHDGSNWTPTATREMLMRVAHDGFPISIDDQLRAIYRLHSIVESLPCSCGIPLNARATRFFHRAEIRTQKLSLRDNDPNLEEILDLVSGTKDFGHLLDGRIELSVIDNFLTKNPANGEIIWESSKSKIRCANCSISLANLIISYDQKRNDQLIYLVHSLAAVKNIDRNFYFNKFLNGSMLLMTRFVELAINLLLSRLQSGAGKLVRAPILNLKRANLKIRDRALSASITRTRITFLAGELFALSVDADSIWKVLAESKKLTLSDKIDVGKSLKYSHINDQILIDLLVQLRTLKRPLKLESRLKLESIITAVIDCGNRIQLSSLTELSNLLEARALIKRIQMNAPNESIFYLWALKRMSVSAIPKLPVGLRIKPEVELMYQSGNSFVDELNALWKSLDYAPVLNSDISLDDWGSKSNSNDSGPLLNAITLQSELELHSPEEDPDLVVCMAIHNSASTLSEAIRSIQNQTFKNWELWCVDDVSEDTSKEIVQEFAKYDKRIKLVSLEKKLGPYRIRNLVLKNSNSMYFGIADSDDWSHPQRFEKQIEILSNKSNLVVVTQHIRLNARIFQTENNGQYIGDGLSSAMFNRNIFEVIGNFLETMTRGDLEYLARITRLLTGRVVVRVSAPLLVARHEFTSNSHQFSNLDLNNFKVAWANFHSKLSAQLEAGLTVANLDQFSNDVVPHALQA